MTVYLQRADGVTMTLPVERWVHDASADELAVLARMRGPVLDVGCGPGRHVLALSQRGVMTLGIDTSPVAVGLARQRGATALVRSVFDPVPAEGRWNVVLLLDGNVGIGGDPVLLLRRAAALMQRGGTILVELERLRTLAVERFTARLRHGDRPGPWFPWARVGVGAVGGLAAQAALRVSDITTVGARCFAWLTR